MSDQCLPGLQGWPVNIGSYVETLFTTQPNDIKLQFGSSGIPWTFDANGFFAIQGSHAFIMNGVQYQIKAVRICKPRQTGLTITSTPFAEYQIWGTPSTPYTNPNTVAVLVIPIFKLTTSDIFGDTLYSLLTSQVANFGNTIPKGDAVRIVRYSTCIESTGPITYTVQTAYWSTGLKMTNEQASRLERNLQPRIQLAENGIPRELFSGAPLPITSYNSNEGVKINKASQLLQNNTIANTYSKSPAMTTTDSLFQSAFRLIKGFQSSIPSTDTSSYKCVSVNRATDIKDGKLLIDPATGEPLDQELQTKKDEESYTIEQPTIYPGDIAKWIGIVIGTILGLVILYAGYMWIKQAMARPKDVVDVAEVVVSGPVPVSPIQK